MTVITPLALPHHSPDFRNHRLAPCPAFDADGNMDLNQETRWRNSFQAFQTVLGFTAGLVHRSPDTIRAGGK